LKDQRGDELIERLLAGAADDSANELLKEVFAGYPAEHIRRLIGSDQPTAAKAGAWLISELGPDARTLMSDVSALLDHPVRDVRFWSVDAVIGGADSGQGAIIAKAVALIGDPDEAVRWKVLQLLARAPRASLDASTPHLENLELRRHVDWLLGIGADSLNMKDVADRLASSDKLTRMFAVAAAARLAPESRDTLERATAAEDREISSFARDELTLRR
jgi:hypothetical protein